jgi:hypothetical protein
MQKRKVKPSVENFTGKKWGYHLTTVPLSTKISFYRICRRVERSGSSYRRAKRRNRPEMLRDPLCIGFTLILTTLICSHPLHLEIQRHRKKPVGILRSSFRDHETGKVKHAQHGRLTGLPLDKLAIIQAALNNKVVLRSDKAALRILRSRELGASGALPALAYDIGLDKLIAPQEPKAQWVRDVMAMCVGQIVQQGSPVVCEVFAGNTQNASTVICEKSGW